jgi:Holliday junction resolvase RusA-like endonuclease
VTDHLRIVIPGEARSCAPRIVTGHRSDGSTFGTMAKAKPERNYSALVRMMATQAAREAHWQRLDGPVGLWVIVYKERPASKTPKRREMRPEELHWITKSDRTNYIKLAEDALKDIVFKDDAQVIAGEPLKLYGAPRLEILVRAITETPEELLRRVLEAFGYPGADRNAAEPQAALDLTA